MMNLSFSEIGLDLPEGKVILISGASSGIGRATVKLLARAGARTVAMARDDTKLKLLAAEIAEAGDTVPILAPGDVRQEDACNAAVALCLRHFGLIDVLVNNAGVGTVAEVSECSTEVYRRTMETNVDGVFFLTRAALRRMRSQKNGHIVMISSNAGAGGNAVAPIYSASKHALEGLTASLRLQLKQWREEGIHVRLSNIWPGTVQSDYWKDRAIRPKNFMSCEEMAAFIVRVIACHSAVNVDELQVQHCRFLS